MENYYSLLGVGRNASETDIKKAFREKAKRLHPDIAGKGCETEMRRLLAAYQTLIDYERRFKYDRAYDRFIGKISFDYRVFLKKQNDPESVAKLIFFDFLHLEDDEAIELWTKAGGPNFRMEAYLDREDWMDCAFILAEELDRRGRPWEAFTLLTALVREERRKPYFRHFMEEVTTLLGELVRLRLRAAVDRETWAECLAVLLGLGFPQRLEKRWRKSLEETLAVPYGKRA
jgi:curved DNA-binding protein CbpA